MSIQHGCTLKKKKNLYVIKRNVKCPLSVEAHVGGSR